MAGIQEPQTTIQKLETSTKTQRALQDPGSLRTSHLLSRIQWKIHPIFHATLLSPYKENDVHGNNFTHPPPDLIDGQEEYEVEAILSHKRLGRRYAYLIKWKGYPSSDNSWEPEQNIVNAPELLSLYK